MALGVCVCVRVYMLNEHIVPCGICCNESTYCLVTVWSWAHCVYPLMYSVLPQCGTSMCEHDGSGWKLWMNRFFCCFIYFSAMQENPDKTLIHTFPILFILTMFLLQTNLIHHLRKHKSNQFCYLLIRSVIIKSLIRMKLSSFSNIRF